MKKTRYVQKNTPWVPEDEGYDLKSELAWAKKVAYKRLVDQKLPHPDPWNKPDLVDFNC